MPIEGATVIANTGNGAPLATVVTTSSGEYEIPNLSVAEIQLAAQSLKVGGFARFRAVVLAAGDNGADLELDLAGSISGQVVDENGQPVAGVHVHAECSGCSDADSGDDTTTKDGHFQLKALMGGGGFTLSALTTDTQQRIPSVEGQAPIMVKDGKGSCRRHSLGREAAAPILSRAEEI